MTILLKCLRYNKCSYINFTVEILSLKICLSFLAGTSAAMDIFLQLGVFNLKKKIDVKKSWSTTVLDKIAETHKLANECVIITVIAHVLVVQEYTLLQSPIKLQRLDSCDNYMKILSKT